MNIFSSYDGEMMRTESTKTKNQKITVIISATVLNN